MKYPAGKLVSEFGVFSLKLCYNNQTVYIPCGHLEEICGPISLYGNEFYNPLIFYVRNHNLSSIFGNGGPIQSKWHPLGEYELTINLLDKTNLSASVMSQSTITINWVILHLSWTMIKPCHYTKSMEHWCMINSCVIQLLTLAYHKGWWGRCEGGRMGGDKMCTWRASWGRGSNRGPTGC